MNKFLALLRNASHVASGVLIASPDPKWQAAGFALAALATVNSQINTKPPTAVPVKIRRARPCPCY